MNSRTVATLPPDIEGARAAKTLPIGDIATSLGIPDDNLHACGTASAKIDLG
jgi:formyltetrahydrofolate synthetase